MHFFFPRKLWKSLSQMLLFPFNGWENRSREAKQSTLCMQLVLKNLLIRFSDIRYFFLVCLFLSKYASMQLRLCLRSWQKMLPGIIHSWAWTSILSLCAGCLFERVPIQERICWDAIQSKTCPCCCELLSKNQAVRHILLCLLDFSIASTPHFLSKAFIYLFFCLCSVMLIIILSRDLYCHQQHTSYKGEFVLGICLYYVRLCVCSGS